MFNLATVTQRYTRRECMRELFIDQRELCGSDRDNIANTLRKLGAKWYNLSTHSLHQDKNFIYLEGDQLTWSSGRDLESPHYKEVTLKELLEMAVQRDEIKLNNFVTIKITYGELLRAGVVGARNNGRCNGKSAYKIAIDVFGKSVIDDCVSIYKDNGQDYASSQLECEAIAFTPKLSEKEVEMNALQEKITELQLAYDRLKETV
jgi:hypothetical protein